MARKLSVPGWNEWSEKSIPKPIGKENFITLRVIGSDRVTQRLTVLSNEEYVFDPETGNQFMIGPIKQPGKPNKKTGVVEPVLYDLWLEPEQQKQWILAGGVRKHEEIWAFIQKSNQFSGNPNRDPSVTPILELVDLDKPIKDSIEERRKRRAAEDYVTNLSDEEVRAYYNDKKQDITLLRESLMLEAEDNPAQFEQQVNEAQNLDIKSCVIDAEKAGIIQFDRDRSTWSMDGEDIFSFKRGVGKGNGKHDQMVKHITENDPDLFDELVERLS